MLSRQLQRPAHPPYWSCDAELSQSRLKVCILFPQGQKVRSAQRCERLTQTPGGQKFFAKVAAVDDNDVDAAGELTMLRAVVQQMNVCGFSGLGCRSSFREQPGFIAGSTDKDWHSCASRDKQRLIAKALCVSCGI